MQPTCRAAPQLDVLFKPGDPSKSSDTVGEPTAEAKKSSDGKDPIGEKLPTGDSRSKIAGFTSSWSSEQISSASEDMIESPKRSAVSH